MKQDNPIEEVWRIRDQIAAECGYDAGRLFDRLRRLQAQHKDRLVRLPPRRPEARAETALREEAPPYGRKPRRKR